MAREKIGRYEVERKLGQGGMATVYLARDPSMKRQVAIKVLPSDSTDEPQFKARFRREAEIVARLEHPHIVPVYDIGEHKSQPYIVMRYMTGGTLSERLRQGRLPLPETTRIVSALAAALDFAHGKRIIHRDLKPANILFDGEGQPYISDFGIAKLAESTTHLTGTGLMGTPMYMSPEQWRADAMLDGRSDVYALGVMVFEILSGKLPFAADTPAQIMYKHLMEPPPRILTMAPDLPAECNVILEKALAKEANERYGTAEVLASALTALVPAPPPAPVAAPPVPVVTPASPPPKPKERPKPAPAQPPPTPASLPVDQPATPQPTPSDLRATGMVGAAPKRSRWSVGLGVGIVTLSLVGVGVLARSGSLLAGATGGSATPTIDTQAAEVTSAEASRITPAITLAATDQPLLSLTSTTRSPGLTTTPALQVITLDNVVNLTQIAQTPFEACCAGLDFSTNGSMFAIARSTGIDVRDGYTLVLITRLGEENTYGPLEFSPDGELLAASSDNGIEIWNVRTREIEATLPSTVSGIENEDMAFSPDGKLLAAGATYPNFTVKIWDVTTGQELQTLTHTAGVFAVDFSPDGQYLVTGSYGRFATLWDVKNGNVIRKWNFENAAVGFSFAFNPAGNLIIASDSVIETYDTNSGSKLRSVGIFSSSALFSADASLAISTDRLFDPEGGRNVILPQRLNKGIAREIIGFSPDSTRLVVFRDGALSLWALPDNTSETQTETNAIDSNPLAVTQTNTPKPSATSETTAYVSAFNGGCNPPSVRARRVIFTIGFDGVTEQEAAAILAEVPTLTTNNVPAQMASRATTAGKDPNTGLFGSYETTFVSVLDSGDYTVSFSWNGLAAGTCRLTVVNP